jgi:hypothetical protein
MGSRLTVLCQVPPADGQTKLNPCKCEDGLRQRLQIILALDEQYLCRRLPLGLRPVDTRHISLEGVCMDHFPTLLYHLMHGRLTLCGSEATLGRSDSEVKYPSSPNLADKHPAVGMARRIMRLRRPAIG